MSHLFFAGTDITKCELFHLLMYKLQEESISTFVHFSNIIQNIRLQIPFGLNPAKNC